MQAVWRRSWNLHRTFAATLARTDYPARWQGVDQPWAPRRFTFRDCGIGMAPRAPREEPTRLSGLLASGHPVSKATHDDEETGSHKHQRAGLGRGDRSDRLRIYVGERLS